MSCFVGMQVKTAALECMTAICGCTGNKATNFLRLRTEACVKVLEMLSLSAPQDLEPFLPAVVDAASSIDKTHACVEKLAGCSLNILGSPSRADEC